ncbi:MAG: TIGR04211 family SH3 domain-containing protein [Desulfotignum sp.]|jgi:SH3 domain protein|nr:TIGR04211 family SH3 domain-containing protein [Desulfotignum sp.]
MTKPIKIFFIICFWGWAVAASAQEVYVSPVTKITMRTGPGVEHKIVAMLVSGTRLDILEYQKDWSRVETDDQKSGWVLTRFLTEDKPLTVEVQNLRRENEGLGEALEKSREENQALIEKNAALKDIEEKYRKLEQASAEFLKLDAEYKSLVTLSEEQQQQIENLKENLNDEEILWFLSGAGVFMVGLILGLSTRKKKKRSLL